MIFFSVVDFSLFANADAWVDFESQPTHYMSTKEHTPEMVALHTDKVIFESFVRLVLVTNQNV